jgi:hypothetical protein
MVQIVVPWDRRIRPVLPQNRSGLKSGHWYLIIECEYCRTRVLMPDLTEGKGTLHEIQKATCPSCLRIGFHAPDTIHRYQYLDPPRAGK